MTDMPEVIYAGDYDEETLSVTAYDHAVGNYQKYIRADKHEELKTIADKMAKAFREVIGYCDTVNFSSHNQMREAIEASILIAEDILTEYSKYKGE